MFESYLLGYLLPWRSMCWVLTLQPLAMAAALLAIKESPYWLVTQGRREEAAVSLQWYRGQGCSIQGELQEIVKRSQEQQGEGGLGEMVGVLTSRPFLRSVPFLGVTIVILAGA